ncbi:hypothetical protein ACOSQ3_003212 [Xanthoceras sorbifolium]
MGDSQQGNDKGKGRVLKKYKVWMVEETNELLKLMLDATNRGWRDSNDLLSKITVEKKILPALNDKLGYSELMRHSSGFRWDPVTKKFTASDESYTTHKNYCKDTTPDYEDLRIAIENGTVVRRHSIGLGDDTDARTFGVEESKGNGLDDLIYDADTEGFIQSDQQEPLYQPPSPDNSTSPLPSQPMRSEVSHATRKRNRAEYEGKSSSSETNNNTQSDAIEKLTETIKELTHVIGSFTTREHSCWDVIRETPNLDNRARFKALGLLNTRAKKIEFLNMTPEERSEWLFYALME